MRSQYAHWCTRSETDLAGLVVIAGAGELIGCQGADGLDLGRAAAGELVDDSGDVTGEKLALVHRSRGSMSG
jgi:hypothetical protein